MIKIMIYNIMSIMGYMFTSVKENCNMGKIYVVLSCVNTGAGKLYRDLTGSDFDHVSVSFGEDLSVMYSFGRLRRDVPFVGGFVSEYPSRFLEGGGDVPIRVYTLDFEEDEYLRLRDIVRRMKTHPRIYTYNIFDKAATVVGGSFKIKRSYTDLSFVCRLLRLGNIRSYRELSFVLSPYLTYEGTLNEKAENSPEHHGAEYFENVSAGRAVASTVAYGAKLIGRKIYDKL